MPRLQGKGEEGSDRRSVGGSRAGVVGGKEKEKHPISAVCWVQALHRGDPEHHAEKGALLAGVGFEILILNLRIISTANIH